MKVTSLLPVIIVFLLGCNFQDNEENSVENDFLNKNQNLTSTEEVKFVEESTLLGQEPFEQIDEKKLIKLKRVKTVTPSKLDPVKTQPTKEAD